MFGIYRFYYLLDMAFAGLARAGLEFCYQKITQNIVKGSSNMKAY